MSAAPSKWLQVISTLNALTQGGKLRWQAEPQPAADPTRNRTNFFVLSKKSYKAQYKDKWFRVTSAQTLTAQPAYVLEVVNEIGESVFTVPETNGVKDLIQSVEYQISGVDALIDSLLQEPKG
jgi:hypothetical protein